ncbi:hypothetical protein L9F63_023094 [Diploptera punctata]|uniref:Uncharacterized protein n=1 Tax=Diploptera punctata TaxID=6984 RepID=A0AAD8E9K8_DIPPU|nr:hypothetical protein L9F63_023094 [Diploptera punctata]
MDGNLTKSRVNTGSSSGTRLSQDSVQNLRQYGDMDSVSLSQHHQQSNISSNYQVANKSMQDDGPRKFGCSNKGSDQKQQVVVPPRMQQQDNNGSNRPKRYSSFRQRSLPESGTTYTQAPPNAYFQAAADLEAGDSGNKRPNHYSTIQPCSAVVYPQLDPAPTYFPPAGYGTPQPVYGDTPQYPLSAGTLPLQIIMPHAHAAGPALQMLPPGAGAIPPFIPVSAPGAPILNYVVTPSAYTAFLSYTAVPAAGPPPTELYQPQSGIMYYNTEERNIVPITQKRQTSALQIVPSPERAPRGHGRTNREETSPPGHLRGAGDASSAAVLTSTGRCS